MPSRKKPTNAAHPAPIDLLPPRRKAILVAAVGVLAEKGYARASTLEIATRARVSKRELYAEFGSKRGILEALIDSGSAEMLAPLVPAAIGDRRAFGAALVAYGAAAIATLSNPYVLALYRLAIAEAPANTELGEVLADRGREPNRKVLTELMRHGQAAGFIGGSDPGQVAAEFFALLMADRMVWLLLAVEPPLAPDNATACAERATRAVLALHPAPAKKPRVAEA